MTISVAINTSERVMLATRKMGVASRWESKRQTSENKKNDFSKARTWQKDVAAISSAMERYEGLAVSC